MSKTFCVLPWIHQAVRNNGTIRLCCQANQGPQKGLLKKSELQFFNAGADNLALARNAELLKDIRLKMLKGEWSPECVRCQTEESFGMRSRRVYEQQLWSEFNYTDAERVTASDGTINTLEAPVLYYDLRFGNKCNLKCRSCGPTDSSSWYEDHYQLWGDKYEDGQYTVRLRRNEMNLLAPEENIYDWYKSNRFWSDLEQTAEKIKHIYMVGGEPLLIEEHYNFLQKCIELGHSEKIEIEYNTNGTVLPDKAFDLWKHFKKVKIGVSIDGIDTVNEFIRYPSKWTNIEKNLMKLENSPENIVVWLAHTVMALNISQLPEFIMWRIKKGFKKINFTDFRPIMSAHPLHSPTFLNAQVLLPEIKNEIAAKFLLNKTELLAVIEKSDYDQSYKKKLQEHSFNLLEQYRKFMFSKDLSSQNNKFKSHVEKLNIIRNQSTPTEISRYI